MNTTTAKTQVDLRQGYRIEITPMISPAGKFGATLQTRDTSGARPRWKDVKHPIVVADTPEAAQSDLATAMNQGLLPGVEVSG